MQWEMAVIVTQACYANDGIIDNPQCSIRIYQIHFRRWPEIRWRKSASRWAFPSSPEKEPSVTGPIHQPLTIQIGEQWNAKNHSHSVFSLLSFSLPHAVFDFATQKPIRTKAIKQQKKGDGRCHRHRISSVRFRFFLSAISISSGPSSFNWNAAVYRTFRSGIAWMQRAERERETRSKTLFIFACTTEQCIQR